MQAAKRLGVPAVIVTDVAEADALVTLRTYYRNRQQTVMDAEHRGMPIYVLRANTVAQVEQFLGDLFNLSSQDQSGSSDTEPTRRNPASHLRSAQRRALGGSAPGTITGATLAARDGAQCGVGESLVWQGTKKACEDIQRINKKGQVRMTCPFCFSGYLELGMLVPRQVRLALSYFCSLA